MVRLMDYMIESGIADTDGITDVELIVADNAAYFWYQDSEREGATWDLTRDFPNIAPPFEDFFIEFNVPKFATGGKVGLMMFGVRFQSEIDLDHWNTKVNLYFRLSGKILKAEADWFLKIGLNGDMLYMNDGMIGPSGRKQSVINVLCTPDYYEMSQNMKVLGILPALFTISLLHCKNVEMRTFIPSKPLSKKHEKRYGVPLVKYKMLEIEPMKKVLRTEGQSNILGLKHALHICRGHFKDYSKGSGLFGKYKGLYWWESHVRGDPSQGAVVKDYNVNPPKDESEQGDPGAEPEK